LPRHKGSWPILSLFDTESDFGEFFNKMKNIDGSYWNVVNLGTFVDGSPYIGVSDPELLREILNNVELFPKKKNVYQSFGETIGRNALIALPEGPIQKRERLLLSSVFHSRPLDDLFSNMTIRIRSFLREIQASSASSYVRAVPAYPTFSRLALQIMSDALFGSDLDSSWLNAKFLHLIESSAVFTLGHMVLGPLWNYIPVRATVECRTTAKEIRSRISELVAERRKVADVGGSKGTKKEGALLNALLEVRAEEERLSGGDRSAEKQRILTQREDDEIIADECLSFLFVGHAIANIISWALYFVSADSKLQINLQREADSFFGPEPVDSANDDTHALVSSINPEMITRLMLHRHAIEETLRLRPPVPGFLDREVTQDVDLANGKLHLCKGTTVTPLFVLNHLSTVYWQDPERFDPGRWERKTDKGCTDQFAFAPFSAGPRNCVASQFVMQEATLILALISRQFDVNRDLNEKVRMSYAGAITPVGLNITFLPRKKQEQQPKAEYQPQAPPPLRIQPQTQPQ